MSFCKVPATTAASACSSGRIRMSRKSNGSF